ncbi:hypothetical protein AB6F62_16535 [Providencia huaxiensis]|uniref:hypothetical protein n=1 Tax=Providencia huaxiensis TaxID=2027290 RepID=UPI0034DD11D1
MQQNPALSENRFNPMTIKDRSSGLNHINELRNKIFVGNDEELKVILTAPMIDLAMMLRVVKRFHS